jgi:hypothetical protein
MVTMITMITMVTMVRNAFLGRAGDAALGTRLHEAEATIPATGACRASPAPTCESPSAPLV